MKGTVNYIVVNKDEKVLRHGRCAEKDFTLQAKHGEYVIEGEMDDSIQKIKNGKIVNKTQQEIEEDKPPEPPEEIQPAYISNKLWSETLERIKKLEDQGLTDNGRGKLG